MVPGVVALMGRHMNNMHDIFIYSTIKYHILNSKHIISIRSITFRNKIVKKGKKLKMIKYDWYNKKKKDSD